MNGVCSDIRYRDVNDLCGSFSNALKIKCEIEENESKLEDANKTADNFHLINKKLCTLPLYLPNLKFQFARNAARKINLLKQKDQILTEYLQSSHELNYANMSHVLKFMLQIEDVYTLEPYTSLIQQNVVIKKHGFGKKKYFYYLLPPKIKGIEDFLTANADEIVVLENRAAASISQAALSHPNFLYPKKKDILLTAAIYLVEKERIVFTTSEQLKEKFFESKYMIIYRPMRYPLRYQYRALELLPLEESLRNFLFPVVNLSKELINFEFVPINAKIANNPEQMQTVRNIVGGKQKDMPYIVFGPPGTGKTTTIVEAILQIRQFNKDSRILVTAGSNSACDTVALRLCEYFYEKYGISIEQRDREEEQDNTKNRVNNKAEESSTESSRAKKEMPNKKLKWEHYKIKKTGDILRIYSKSILQKSLSSINKIVLGNSNLTEKKQVEKLNNEDIQKYGIIVATLGSVGGMLMRSKGEALYHFSHIFIDEAGSISEAETLVGIMGVRSKENKFILAGDHKQLGPVIQSAAKQYGLEVSMMERLMLRNSCYALSENGNYDQTVQSRLRRNYRSHPQIVRLYNQLYYDNELIAAAETSASWSAFNAAALPNPNFPIIFQEVYGTMESPPGCTSLCNYAEIDTIFRYLQRLLTADDASGGWFVKRQDIGIITPYKLQANIIERKLKARGWQSIEVGSVEKFQGREKHILLASFVRSQAMHVGFLKNPRRLNVLLSRAQSLLIIFGNSKTLSCINALKFVIDECKNHQTFINKNKEARHPIFVQKSAKLSNGRHHANNLNGNNNHFETTTNGNNANSSKRDTSINSVRFNNNLKHFNYNTNTGVLAPTVNRTVPLNSTFPVNRTFPQNLTHTTFMQHNTIIPTNDCYAMPPLSTRQPFSTFTSTRSTYNQNRNISGANKFNYLKTNVPPKNSITATNTVNMRKFCENIVTDTVTQATTTVTQATTTNTVTTSTITTSTAIVTTPITTVTTPTTTVNTPTANVTTPTNSVTASKRSAKKKVNTKITVTTNNAIILTNIITPKKSAKKTLTEKNTITVNYTVTPPTNVTTSTATNTTSTATITTSTVTSSTAFFTTPTTSVSATKRSAIKKVNKKMTVTANDAITSTNNITPKNSGKNILTEKNTITVDCTVNPTNTVTTNKIGISNMNFDSQKPKTMTQSKENEGS